MGSDSPACSANVRTTTATLLSVISWRYCDVNKTMTQTTEFYPYEGLVQTLFTRKDKLKPFELQQPRLAC